MPQPLTATEAVSTFDADGRVLAQDLVSALQVPPQDNSSMDGYAVRSARDRRRGRGAAGAASAFRPAAPAQPLEPGSAARIFTGAPIPPGADAVVMQEDSRAGAASRSVRILRVPAAGPVDPPQRRRRHARRRRAGARASA